MCSVPFLERLPSTWRLAILQGGLVLGNVILCVLLAGWALRSDLDRIAAAVVLDDLGEYAVIYDRGGVKAVEDVFVAGKHEESQALRILAPDGRLLFERIPKAVETYTWPSAHPSQESASILVVPPHPHDKHRLLAGFHVLGDGNILWFGRTNAEDHAYEEHIRSSLWIAGWGAFLFGLVPLWWFIVQVLNPLRQMMLAAENLSERRTNVPMVAPGAVPELLAFARAYNHGLEQIAALTRELQNANDSLAHELRTPLARIRGNLETYLDTTDHPEAREAAARSLDEIDRAARLIHSILTIRAGELKALQLYRESVDMRMLLGQLFELYAPGAAQIGLALQLDAPESETISVDELQISQAIANLLDNALAYTPAGGTVGISLALTDSKIRISVTDSGPGLLPEEMEKIWSRHVRGSAAVKHAYGNGLGLSFVRSIAIAHSGSAGCENRPSGGAVFWIELPRRGKGDVATG